MSVHIEFNKVTWYSKLLAALIFLIAIPVLVFYIGRQYERTIEVLADSCAVALK